MATIERQTDNLDSSDLLKPEVKLIQSTGGEKIKEAGGQPGQLYNVVSGEIYKDGMEFVVLDIIKGRTFWGTDEIGDNPPLCASLNAKSYESINGENCHECEHLLENAAMVDAKTRRDKCCPNFTILGINLETMSPFLLRANGISATPVSNLLTQMAYNKAAHNAEDPRKIDWHKFKITVVGAPQKTKNGTAYALQFKNITLFGDEKFEHQMFETSAVLLGQANILMLPEPSAETESKAPAAPPPAAPKTETSRAPKVNNVSRTLTAPAKPGETKAPATVGTKFDMDI